MRSPGHAYPLLFLSAIIPGNSLSITVSLSPNSVSPQAQSTVTVTVLPAQSGEALRCRFRKRPTREDISTSGVRWVPSERRQAQLMPAATSGPCIRLLSLVAVKLS